MHDEVVVNEYGGKQSSIGGARFDLIPPLALEEVAIVLGRGAAKYGEDNWRQVTVKEHINHALNHLNKLLMGDESEPNLSHAITRLMMAYEVDQLGVRIDASYSNDKNQQQEQPSFEQLFNEIYNTNNDME